ncbi:MAG: undecaprenyl-phosphate glucose phosphotransferase [Candidatus Nitrohelix vancouverensis]|uniref:Undecaprenyl-phosphate glucose phosphotransferase n=1 Tax=Candidatus Nitrohelix vancouverensis TaxID=2705534 RepID=A0A7T0G422_9BACT|nr:MAG: undecaprenyl-phosphate glucose phosphotransferase [Candidatus Nitrohelix vancouverensis]
MLKKHGQLFLSTLIFADSLVIVVSWLTAFWARVNLPIFPLLYGEPAPESYYLALIPVWAVFMLTAKSFGLYRPLRGKSFSAEFLIIVKSTLLSGLILSALAFYYREESFSRLIATYFIILEMSLLTLSHWVIRLSLMKLRKKGFNLRHVLIIGSGSLANSLAERLKMHPEYGFSVVGFIDEYPPSPVQESSVPMKYLGDFNKIPEVIKGRGIDQVYIALPLDRQNDIVKILVHLSEETVTIKVVPDLLQFMNLQAGVEDLDGMPIISLSDSPLYGWNIIIKRTSDIILSCLALLLASPIMALIAIAIKLESRGPIFYRQEREGLDRKVFDMLKFRSMRVDAEDDSGPVWARQNDDRRTRLGTFLRSTSLDELPQIFNVLKGDMSLVGPRPERPVFVDDFKKTIPHYMLRLKMKAGVTGWAQVNGWRGNTSLEKRIEYDLYYIRHWSFWFDIKILFMTLWKGFVNPHAY